MALRPRIPDYYLTLGCSPEATDSEIRKSYRRLARSWKKTGMKGVGVVAMAAIDEAYDTLKDVDKREDYDEDYPRIRKAWAKYQRRRAIAAALEEDDADSNHSSDEEDQDSDGEEHDDEDDTDDGGPDGEVVDDTYTDREQSEDEDTIAVALVKRRTMVIVIDSDDEEEKSEEEPEAEFTDGEEPLSDDEMDESVDIYAHYCIGYAPEDSESDEETDQEASYAVKLRSGRYVEMKQHYHDDPDHMDCELEDY